MAFSEAAKITKVKTFEMLSNQTPSGLPFADDTANYLYQRAEEELDLAQTADHPAAVKAHYTLAGHYLDTAYGMEGGKARAA